MSGSVGLLCKDSRIFPSFLFQERWSTGHTMLPGSLLTASGWRWFCLCLASLWFPHLVTPLQHHSKSKHLNLERQDLKCSVNDYFNVTAAAAEVLLSGVLRSQLWWWVAVILARSSPQQNFTFNIFPIHLMVQYFPLLFLLWQLVVGGEVARWFCCFKKS